jgi:ubiquinone/menaquinone biosynthesis C-methylase UbiE
MSHFSAIVVDDPPFPILPGRNWWQATVEMPWIAATLGIPRDARILEIGCGEGTALAWLADNVSPRRLVGIDLDRQAVGVARRRVPEAAVHHGDARSLPLQGARFDVVFDFGTCYHIARPDRALREIARMLVPGGRLIHETPLGQLLAHPYRSFGRVLPWDRVPELRPDGHAGLFASRVRR